MGRLQGIIVDIEGVSTQTDFEVIEIVDDNNPYPALLEINWATDMNGVINLKNQKMIFEKNSLCVVVPLDPVEWARYTKLIADDESDDELDCIYQITARDQDRVNPTTNRRISWERDSSCTLDSNEEVEHWKNRLHEVTTLNFNMMIRSLRYVTTEAREPQTYDGVTTMDELQEKFESVVPEQQQYAAMEGALCTTPAQGWNAHQGTMVS